MAGELKQERGLFGSKINNYKNTLKNCSNVNMGVIVNYGITKEEFSAKAIEITEKIIQRNKIDNEEAQKALLETVMSQMMTKLLSVNAYTQEAISLKMREQFENINVLISGPLKEIAKGIKECKKNIDLIINKLNAFKEENDIKYKTHIINGNKCLDLTDFENAKQEYNKAIAIKATSEAYFGLALAELKIHYIYDEETNREQPICYDIYADLANNSNYRIAIGETGTLTPTEAEQDEYKEKAQAITAILEALKGYEKEGKNYDCFICVKVSEIDNDLNKIKNEEGKFVNTADKEWVDGSNLYSELKNTTYSNTIAQYIVPFYSEKDIDTEHGTPNYNALISYALYRAKCLIFVCSDKKYLKTRWVRSEFLRFKEYCKKRGMNYKQAVIIINKTDSNLNDSSDSVLKDDVFNTFSQHIHRDTTDFSIDLVTNKVRKMLLSQSEYVGTRKICPKCGRIVPNDANNIKCSVCGDLLLDSNSGLVQYLDDALERATKAEREVKALEQDVVRLTSDNEQLKEEKSKLEECALTQIQDEEQEEDSAEELDLSENLDNIEVPQNASKKVRKLFKKAKDGNARAQYKLGRYYLDGNKKEGITIDKKEAVVWLRRSAEHGNAEAQVYLGYCYSQGIGVEINDNLAFRWWNRAAEKKEATGQYNLGCEYQRIGQYEEAFKWFQRSAMRGEVSAYKQLSVCYRDGRGVETDAKKAGKWAKQADKEIISFFIFLLGGLAIYLSATVLCIIWTVLFEGNIIFPLTSSKVWLSYVILFSVDFVIALSFGIYYFQHKEKRLGGICFMVLSGVSLLVYILLSLSSLSNIITCDYGKNGIGYILQDNGTLSVCAAEAKTKEAEIASEIDGYEVTTIEANAFRNNTSLKSVTIPESVTSIGDGAFYNCSRLKSITIPENVTSIGQSVFAGCENLEVVYWNAIDCKFLTTGYTLWGKNPTVSQIIFGEHVTVIPENSFDGCSSLTSVTIPDSVTSIGEYAFYNCTSLESVTIGEGVTSIGDWAFRNCTALTEINYNATACEDLSSGNFVFSEAGQSGEGITVNIGANVANIPAYLFFSSYIDSYVPQVVTINFAENSVCASIGTYAFAYVSSLESVTIPESVTSIGEYAFYNCTSLESVTIGEGVTSIGDWTFRNCTSLASVTFENVDGWWVSTSSLATSGTYIDVSNVSQNATYLTDTYYLYYWKRG